MIDNTCFNEIQKVKSSNTFLDNLSNQTLNTISSISTYNPRSQMKTHFIVHLSALQQQKAKSLIQSYQLIFRRDQRSQQQGVRQIYRINREILNFLGENKNSQEVKNQQLKQMVHNQHSAIQIAITVLSTPLFIERLIFFGYIFAQPDCSNYLLLGVACSYLVQLFFARILKNSMVSKSQNPFPFILSFVFTIAGGAAAIVPAAVALSQSDFESSKEYSYQYCDLAIRIAVGIPQIITGVPIMTMSCLLADICRRQKKKPEDTSEKEFNMMFTRFLFQALNELCFFMLIMAFVNNLYWGGALLVSMALSILVWLFFSSSAHKNKLTFMQFRARGAINFEHPDCCTLLLLLPLILLGPVYFFLVGSLGLLQLWQIQDGHPQQYYYVNINFLLKLLFLLPTGFLYLAFAIVNEREVYFFYAFIAFWLFTLSNILLPILYTGKRHGCKRKLLLATPNNALFTKEEVRDFYEKDIKKILPQQEKE